MVGGTSVEGLGATRVGFYPEGVQAGAYRGGYVVLVHGTHLMARLVRLGQRLRFTGDQRRYAWWNHVALVLDGEGNLAEALPTGVMCTNITKYVGTDYYLIEVELSPQDEQEVVAFAQSVLDAPERTKYDWWTIASLTISQLTGSRIVFGKIGTAICSGFVSEALVRAGAIFPRPPDYMTPADLADYFHIV
jgi:hypothetical protein